MSFPKNRTAQITDGVRKTENIRRAEMRDVARIAEIEVFNYRQNFFPIFRSDSFYFDQLQVPRLMDRYRENRGILTRTLVYDDGVVKGFARIDGEELEKLFVEPVLQGEGIGTCLLRYAIAEANVRVVWALEKNTRAIAFYKRSGFHVTDNKKFEDGTTEYLVQLCR